MCLTIQIVWVLFAQIWRCDLRCTAIYMNGILFVALTELKDCVQKIQQALSISRNNDPFTFDYAQNTLSTVLIDYSSGNYTQNLPYNA